MNLDNFRQQIKDDIDLVQKSFSYEKSIRRNEYAFNHWILTNLYGLDDEIALANITEYSDKGIDCFAHYEEDKELYLIQNKYYSSGTSLVSQEVSDFFTRPLATLKAGDYKRSQELQDIYNKAKEDTEYKIFLHFYTTTESLSVDIQNIVKHTKLETGVYSNVFHLKDIQNKYYHDRNKESKSLEISLPIKVEKSALAIRPAEYGLTGMSKAFYAMTKVIDIRKMWLKAEKEDYPLFEENIREYLGNSGINKKIIETLKDSKSRVNFFYYNNGITIICDDANITTDSGNKQVDIKNPQIVNGCQTVNSIVEALKGFDTKEIKSEFKNVYVISKILVTEKDEQFYKNVVEYTNSQNSIDANSFGAVLAPFDRVQDSLRDYGILLLVKQSDKNTFNTKYKEKKQLHDFLKLANNSINENFYIFSKIADTQIKLEMLLQIIGAFVKDAHFAYTKKSTLLKPTSDFYKEFSKEIIKKFTVNQILKLIFLYKKAEYDKKQSEDKKTPVPYYFLNFIGRHLENKSIEKLDFLQKLEIKDLHLLYLLFKPLSGKYYRRYRRDTNYEYNQMIKKTVNKGIMDDILGERFDELDLDEKNKYKNILQLFENK